MYERESISVIESISKKATRLAEDLGVENFELREQDLKFIMACRAVGWGNIEKVVIEGGLPVKAVNVVQSFNFGKDIVISDTHSV